MPIVAKRKIQPSGFEPYKTPEPRIVGSTISKPPPPPAPGNTANSMPNPFTPLPPPANQTIPPPPMQWGGSEAGKQYKVKKMLGISYPGSGTFPGDIVKSGTIPTVNDIPKIGYEKYVADDGTIKTRLKQFKVKNMFKPGERKISYDLPIIPTTTSTESYYEPYWKRMKRLRS
ncbi:MAG: hypothetical protein V1709_08595 [Planctomycetota bacterium]